MAHKENNIPCTTRRESTTGDAPSADKAVLSAVITRLRLPLIMGVLLIHSNVPQLQLASTGSLPDAPAWAITAVSNVALMLDSTVTQVFFFISGLLFFFNTSELPLSVYRQKLRRRVTTLLVPYLIWNVVFLAFHAAKAHFGISQGSAASTAADWLRSACSAFWNYSDDCPADLPLWYVRDLMVVVVFTPLIRLLVKRPFAAAGLPILAAWACLFPSISATGINPRAFFYFALGAFFSVNKMPPAPSKGPATAAAVLALTATTVFAQQVFFSPTGEIFRLLAVWGIIATALGTLPHCHGKAFGRWIESMSGTTFFIYAAHALFATLSVKALSAAIHTSGAAQLFAVFLLSPLLTLAATMALHGILQRLAPRLARMLGGMR